MIFLQRFSNTSKKRSKNSLRPACPEKKLLPALSCAGVAIGADGLIVEVHPAPEKAISDGAQSLDLPQFQKMMKDLEPYIQLWNLSRKKEEIGRAHV